MFPTLPPEYQWIRNEAVIPDHALVMLEFYGIKEIPGPKSNATIIAWAKELNTAVGKWYQNDDEPWCALCMGIVLKRSGWQVPEGFKAIRASEYQKVWEPVFPELQPRLWDMVIFKRPGGYHVGLCVGEDKDYYHILGGNQSNKVGINRMEKARAISVRQMPYKGGMPKYRRVIKLHPSGTISKNEA